MSVFNDYHPPILSGAGTPELPYLISTATELGSVIYQKQGACYRLTQNIDLSVITWSMSVVLDLTGVFNGNGFTICNIKIVGDDNLGLFGIIKGNGQILNLGVVDANVSGTGNYICILVGSNNGHLLNCYSTGTLDGVDYVGGLVGYNCGDVTNCYSTS